MCNSLLGRSKARKQAEKQAEIEVKAANRAAAADTEAARSNQISRENVIERDRALEEAEQYLRTPMGTVDVDVGRQDPAEIDPETGRRKPTRAAFMSKSRYDNIGVKI